MSKWRYVVARAALGVVVFFFGLLVGAQAVPDGRPMDHGAVVFCFIVAFVFESAYVAYILW
jgi:hypothetical protein